MVLTKMINSEKLKKLFYVMLRIRLIEEAIAKRYTEGKMRCPTHLSIGQEAVAAVIGAQLRQTDLVVSSHRAHAHYLAKGGSLCGLIAELHGKKTGCTQGRGGSMNLSDLAAGFVASKAIVGNTIPVGVGLALAQLLKNSTDLTCIFFGDAAVEEGAFYESLNYAVLERLPVIFVCENNLYSVNTPLSLRQPQNRPIFELARAIGAKAAQFDGNDITANCAVVEEIFVDLRNKSGPWFVEFLTYRYKVHCGHEDDLDDKYRPKAELDYWLARDPILLLENQLTASSILSLSEIAQYRQHILAEINEAFNFAQMSPFPAAVERFDYQYADSNLEWLKRILTEEMEGRRIESEIHSPR